MLVTIITPVTGNPLMQQAIQSVQDQDYPHIEHLIMIDGQEREVAARAVLETIEFKKPQTHIHCLPYSTGEDGFNGHRIYGMSTFLANGDYLVFLDEDNWFDPQHISSLVQLVQEKNLDWAYALRKIIDENGEHITNDNCESLGKWPTFKNNYHHVDTNCYFLKKHIAIKHSHLLYARFAEPGSIQKYSPDILLCNELLKTYPHCDTPGKYSVNYRAGMGKFSVKASFFEEGNAIMHEKYPQGFPWQKSTVSSGTTKDNSSNVLAFPKPSQNEQNSTLQEAATKLLKQLGLENPYLHFNYQDYPLDLQGWGSTDPIFEQLIDQVKPQLIIEVGSWKGASAVQMAKLLQEKSIHGTLLCIDTWLGAIEHLAGEYATSLQRKHGFPTLYYQFLANVMHQNVQDRIIPLPNPSHIAARYLQKQNIQADLIYIDASHEAEDVYADVCQYWEVLKPNGVMFGDDYGDVSHIGVSIALHQFAKERNLHLKTIRNKWWLQKPATEKTVIQTLNQRIAQLELMLINQGVEFASRNAQI